MGEVFSVREQAGNAIAPPGGMPAYKLEELLVGNRGAIQSEARDLHRWLGGSWRDDRGEVRRPYRGSLNRRPGAGRYAQQGKQRDGGGGLR
jgi:hypothetical protein